MPGFRPEDIYYWTIFPFVVLAIVSFIGFVLWILIRLIFPQEKQPLSEYDKRVLCLNFDKGSKNRVGYLEIINNTLSFRSIDMDKETIVIPLKQIISVKTDTKPAGFWSTWGHYLWVTYRSDTELKEREIGFMVQTRSGIYGEEIRSTINRLIKSKET